MGKQSILERYFKVQDDGNNIYDIIRNAVRNYVKEKYKPNVVVNSHWYLDDFNRDTEHIYIKVDFYEGVDDELSHDEIKVNIKDLNL